MTLIYQLVHYQNSTTSRFFIRFAATKTIKLYFYKMYRHLYKNPSLISKILQNEFQNYRCEELGFRYAALAKLRESRMLGNPDEHFIKEWELLHQLSLEEQWELSKNSLLSQLYRILEGLNSPTRSQPLIQHTKVEQIAQFTGLVDPDMFPVSDLAERVISETGVSIWDKSESQIQEATSSIRNKVHQKVGFFLEVRDSSIPHMEAGRGVYLRTTASVPPGTLLGLVPGVVYDNYQEMTQPTSDDSHFFRFDGTLFNFDESVLYPVQHKNSKEEMENKIAAVYELSKLQKYSLRDPQNGGFERVNGSQINPYAVGHLVNHTPLDGNTNVCLVDLFVPKNFYPDRLMRFWPNLAFSEQRDYMTVGRHRHPTMRKYLQTHFRGLGLVSVTEINDNEELYMDYIDSSFFKIQQNPPNWLIEPAPVSPFITKGHFENRFNWATQILEDYLFSRSEDGKNYTGFNSKVDRNKLFLDKL